MGNVVSATEARARFGEVMRRAAESREPVVVKRAGKPYVVIISVDEYERLQAMSSQEDWPRTRDAIVEVNRRIRARRGDSPLTPPEDLIREMREARDAELSHLR